jgi:hypothetical protein
MDSPYDIEAMAKRQNPIDWHGRCLTEKARADTAEAELVAMAKTALKRCCRDCSEVFEWHQVDDAGRCHRCYQRFCSGEPRLKAGPEHPSRRYVLASSLKDAEQQIAALTEAAKMYRLVARHLAPPMSSSQDRCVETDAALTKAGIVL